MDFTSSAFVEEFSNNHAASRTANQHRDGDIARRATGLCVHVPESARVGAAIIAITPRSHNPFAARRVDLLGAAFYSGNGMQLQIGRAGAETHRALTDIAHAAKRHWGYPEHWMERWRDVLTITPDYIADNEVYVARAGDEIVGFYALIDGGVKATLDHLWLLPSQMGAGMGRSLFNHAMAAARRLGAEEVEVEADPNAFGFYERMGATPVGENVYEIDGQPRVLPLLIYKLV